MYLSRRRPSHTQALLEAGASHEDGMRRLSLRRDEEGVRKHAASHTRRPTCVHTERTSHAPEPQKNPHALNPLSHHKFSPPCLPAFTATIKLAEP